MIEPVTQANLMQAAEVHAASWCDANRAICSAEFLSLHTAQRQAQYLQQRMEDGARIYLLSDDSEPVGIVSVQDDVIGDLYVMPEKQGRGYGTRLLRFAMSLCAAAPTLWVLAHNRRAMALYERMGFRATGEKHAITETLSEIAMRHAK